MEVRVQRVIRASFVAILYMCLFSTLPALAAKSSGSKTKITGVVISRDGNLVKVQQKSGSMGEVRISDGTKLSHDQKMGVRALVPGLKVKVIGTRDEEGVIEAKKVVLHPDAFAIAVAQQQEIMAAKQAAGYAQASADEGIAKAGAAQNAADQAQNTANQGLTTAQSASAMASANETAVRVVNGRLADMANFNVVASSSIYFANGSSRLTKESKATLDRFMAENKNVNGYLIGIEGYTSTPGRQRYNQTLSDRRAAAVAEYLREKADVPAWKFVTPAGYGESHPVAENSSSKGRAANRRVEIKVLVSRGIQPTGVALASSN